MDPAQAEAYAEMDEVNNAADGSFRHAKSPTARSIWQNVDAAWAFRATRPVVRPEIQEVMTRCLDFALEMRSQGNLRVETEHGPLFSRDAVHGLAERGFFGIVIPSEYGGSGATIQEIGPFLTDLTTHVDP